MNENYNISRSSELRTYVRSCWYSFLLITLIILCAIIKAKCHSFYIIHEISAIHFPTLIIDSTRFEWFIISTRMKWLTYWKKSIWNSNEKNSNQLLSNTLHSLTQNCKKIDLYLEYITILKFWYSLPIYFLINNSFYISRLLQYSHWYSL